MIKTIVVISYFKEEPNIRQRHLASVRGWKYAFDKKKRYWALKRLVRGIIKGDKFIPLLGQPISHTVPLWYKP